MQDRKEGICKTCLLQHTFSLPLFLLVYTTKDWFIHSLVVHLHCFSCRCKKHRMIWRYIIIMTEYLKAWKEVFWSI
jgi:hypothetical protein